MIIEADIETSWSNCLAVWSKRGRVEDLPRDTRVPRYQPDEGKCLGSEFAGIFKEQYQFLIDKLTSDDPVVALCAFEVLEFICWEYYVNNVPDDILNIGSLLPSPIDQEVRNDRELELPFGQEFSGRTVGDLLRAKFVDPKV